MAVRSDPDWEPWTDSAGSFHFVLIIIRILAVIHKCPYVVECSSLRMHVFVCVGTRSCGCKSVVCVQALS